MTEHIPVIDIKHASSLCVDGAEDEDASLKQEDAHGEGNNVQMQQIMEEVRKALGASGFFFVRGHGVRQEVMDAAMNCARRFFSLEMDVKQRYMSNKEQGDPPLGYSGKTIVLNPTLQSTPDTREQYKVGNSGYREAYKSRCSRDIQSTDPPDAAFYWPESEIISGLLNEDFKQQLKIYFHEMRELGHKLMRIICAAFNVEYNPIFDDKNMQGSCFDKPMHLLSLLRYDGTISDVNASLFGCGPHTDYGCLTILQLDPAVGGLEVYIENNDKEEGIDADGNWVEVNPIKGCFVVNAGEMLKRWTNGRVQASLHRVVSKSNVPRYSIPFFFEPNIDCFIEPLDACVKAEDDKKFDKIKV